MRLRYELQCTDGAARCGRVHARHGAIETPAFMPVGTYGTVKAMTPEELEGIGAQIVLGNTFHLMLRPGAETVAELGALADRPAAWADWAERFALTALAERPLASLSGGERQAAHLARLFASLEEPYGALLLLDEPTAALDRARRETVHAAVQAWARAGAAVLVATHDAAWARTFPRVVALEEGRLIADGPPAAAFTAELVRAVWGAPAT